MPDGNNISPEQGGTAARGAETEAAQAAKLQQFLANLSTEDRQKLSEELSALPPDQQQQFFLSVMARADAAQESAQDAAEGIEDVGNWAADRQIHEGKAEPEIDERLREDVSDAAEVVAPDVPKEQIDDVVERDKAIKERVATGSPITDEEIENTFKDHFTKMGLTQDNEKTDAVMRSYGISEDDIPRIKAVLPAEKPESDKMTTAEEIVKGKAADILKDKIISTKDKIETELQSKIDEPGMSEKAKAHHREDQIKVRGLFSKFTDLFGPDEKGREFASKVGKTLYITAIIIFLFIILEMTLINRAASKRR